LKHNVIYVLRKLVVEIKMDTHQQRLVRGSRRLAFVFSVLFWAGVLWVFSDAIWRPLKVFVAAQGSPAASAGGAALARAVLAQTPTFALMGALWTAIGLFNRFAQGEALTAASGRSLSRIGGWFIASAIASGLFSDVPAMPAMRAMTMPPAIDAELVLCCVGAALVLLGRAFSAAAAIKAEHDQIV